MSYVLLSGIGIEVVEAARVERGLTPVNCVCTDKRSVLRCGHASPVRHRPENRSIAVCSPVIGSGRTVGNSGVNYIDDALRDDSILEHRLVQIRNVIADNVTSEALLDVDWIGKAGKPAERQRMLFANPTSPVSAVAKPMRAFGAMSATI